MPNIVQGASDGRYIDLSDINHEYEYPNGLDLKPGSEIHKIIVDKIMERARQSHTVMSKRFPSWNKIDESLTAYIPVDEIEKKVQARDSRKPVSIVVPYSYATMETLLSYLVATFLDDPILRYKGRGNDDIIGAKMLQMVISQQAQMGKLGLRLHTMFRDCLSYGLGPVVATWDMKIGKRTIRQPKGFFDFKGIFNNTGNGKTEIESVLFEGNVLKNINPYNVLPDPSVSIHDIQLGEFFGWIDNTNKMDLLSREQMDSENYFNGKYLNRVSDGRTAISKGDKSSREKRFGGNSELSSSVKNYVDVVYMYVKLIPKEWKLGESEYPETWFFGIAADSIVVEARELGLNHGMIPATVAAPDYDGYSCTPTSRMEIIYGLQHTIDWLFSSHITNVRKAINDVLIVDPYLINIADLEDPEPGKLIRMRRAAWGQNKVGDAVKQLQVNDITRSNIGDSQYLMDLMNRVSAASDGVQGIQNRTGERVSASEARGTQQSALSRLERIAKVVSMQAMQDIGLFFASHTQQLMSKDTYVDITSDEAEVLRNMSGSNPNNQRMKVTPYDLLVETDLDFRDNLTPGGGFPEIWTQLFQTIMQNPELGQGFDAVKIFKYIAYNLGAKNINDFAISSNIVPDETAAEELRKGNIMPIGDLSNGS